MTSSLHLAHLCLTGSAVKIAYATHIAKVHLGMSLFELFHHLNLLQLVAGRLSHRL